jgi:hypothetical protein
VLAVRHREIIPRLAGASGYAGDYALLGAGAFRASWHLGDGSRLHLLANLSAQDVDAADASPAGRIIWREATRDAVGDRLAPWSLTWSIDGG